MSMKSSLLWSNTLKMSECVSNVPVSMKRSKALMQMTSQHLRETIQMAKCLSKSPMQGSMCERDVYPLWARCL